MAIEITAITGEELAARLTRGMALLLGPGFSRPRLNEELAQALTAEFRQAIDPVQPYYEAVDNVLDSVAPSDAAGAKERAEKAIRDGLSLVKPTANDRKLAGFRWSAVLSFNLDTCFDEALRKEVIKAPGHKPVIQIDQAGVQVPRRCTPIFHLMGLTSGDRFVVDGADYQAHRRDWRHLSEHFIDRAAGDPTFCVGLSNSQKPILDLVAELSGSTKLGALTLIFLEEERDSISPALLRYLPPGSKVHLFGGHVSELLRSARDAQKAGYSPSLPFDAEASRFLQFSDLLTAVHEQVGSDLTAEERNSLQELLFSPTLPRWEPFVHDLDLRRSDENVLLAQIESEDLALSGQTVISGVLLGSAASGKTTLLKRIAFELVKRDRFVFWLRPYNYSESSRLLRQLFDQLRGRKERKGRVVVVVDDPLSLFGVEARDVYHAARAARVRVLILVGARTSDWQLERDKARFTGSPTHLFVHTLDDRLNDDEWSRLPRFMVNLNVAPDEGEALRMLEECPDRGRKDSLATMYWLLEGVRSEIQDSVKQEYLRLGQDAAQHIVGALVGAQRDILKRAYGLVAVGEQMGSVVPFEVLVTALGCSYPEWHDAIPSHEKAWGVLYEQVDQFGDSVAYRCRNSVVANIVTETLNGGSLGHSGEFSYALELLSACDGSGQAYRGFCRKLLNSNNHRLSARGLSLDEILALFEAALGAFADDQTVLHQYALMLTRAHRFDEAIDALKRAMALPGDPFQSRQELPEHMHTSYASIIVKKLRAGQIDDNEALRIARHHLERARSETYHNARAVHVQARLALRLTAKTTSDSDRSHLIVDALADIERYLLFYAAPLEADRAPLDTEMLEDIRRRIVEKVIPDDLDLERTAEKLWNDNQDQVGFALSARRLLALATGSLDSGKLFKRLDEYCRAKAKVVSEAGIPLSRELAEVTLSGYFRWRFRGQGTFGYDGFSSGTDWPYVRDLALSIIQASESTYPAFRYMLGVAYAHLGDWPASDAAFGRIKESGLRPSTLWTRRDVYRDEKGAYREVQGELKKNHQTLHVSVPELGSDFRVIKGDNWPRAGVPVAVYLVFSFGGARATLERPR